jgi:hypothetical protein
MTWYENPTIAAILGAVVGAVLASIVSLFIWKKTHKIKRVDGIINDISSLLTFSDKIKDQLEIKFSGSEAKSVYLFSIEIINSGTEAIINQPVGIRLNGSAKIVDYTIDTVPEVGFGDILESQKNGNALDLNIALLNQNDRVSIELVSLDNQNEDIDIYLKNANVLSRVYSRKSAERELIGALGDREMVVLAVSSIIPFFGGIAKTLMTLSLAKRIDKISKKDS